MHGERKISYLKHFLQFEHTNSKHLSLCFASFNVQFFFFFNLLVEKLRAGNISIFHGVQKLSWDYSKCSTSPLG